jgi:hypothetical protein
VVAPSLVGRPVAALACPGSGYGRAVFGCRHQCLGRCTNLGARRFLLVHHPRPCVGRRRAHAAGVSGAESAGA